MKKLQSISMLPLLLILTGFVLTNSSCKKTNPKMCEENNTFTLIVKNTALSGNLNFNINKDFHAINEPGDYSVKPGESLNIELKAGSHNIYARNVRTVCTNNCSTTVTAYPAKTVNQQSCTEANLVY